MPRASPAAVGLAAVAVAVLLLVPGSTSRGSPEPVAAGRTTTRASLADLSVAIDPGSWWMETGANTTFVTTWVGTPAGCSLDPIWFRWAIGPGGSEGTLATTNGSRTTFLATDDGSGTTTIVVHAAASLHCRGNVTAAFASASANVTVAAALTVSNLAVEPDPVAPGQTTALVGSVVGGDPPYRLRVEWGDGNVTYENVSWPGPFSIPYTYGNAGSFEPALLASDAAGRVADSDPEEPAYVSSGFAAAIVPSTPVAEVGVPATFGVATIAPPRNFSFVFACEDALPAGNGSTAGIVYGCAFDSAGVAPVTFEAVGSSSPFPIASATLDEEVVPSPVLGFPADPPTGEVALSDYAPLTLVGGVPPFTVTWSLVGTGLSGVQTVASDGVDYLPLDSAEAGTLVLSVLVVDALGVASPGATEVVEFAPALQATAVAGTSVVAGAVAVNVSGNAVEGAPPFDWTVVPSSPATNDSEEGGTLAQAGGFAWNATYRAEGALAAVVAVVDADGASTVLNLSVGLVPSLTVAASVGPVGPGLVTLALTVSGGMGPFAYRWNDSFGDVWNGTVTTAGTFSLHETPRASGPCSFYVLVVDTFGVSASSELHTTVPSASILPAAGSVVPTLAVILAILAAPVAAVLLLRRRRTSGVSPPPDPVAVLREAIEPSDGVDRGLVELLAEERGVPLATVRATLERLKADGTVRSGRGNDGEEVLAWSEPPLR